MTKSFRDSDKSKWHIMIQPFMVPRLDRLHSNLRAPDFTKHFMPDFSTSGYARRVIFE
jgi:hypothetical protein